MEARVGDHPPPIPPPSLQRRIEFFVAQSCTLLYRGFVIRKAPDDTADPLITVPCRMQFGDTADLEICATKKSVLRPLIH